VYVCWTKELHMQASLEDSPLDFLDAHLLADDDAPQGRRPVPSREQWGRTPDALAGQQASADLAAGTVEP
jgi:hypothetical protein